MRRWFSEALLQHSGSDQEFRQASIVQTHAAVNATRHHQLDAVVLSFVLFVLVLLLALVFVVRWLFSVSVQPTRRLVCDLSVTWMGFLCVEAAVFVLVFGFEQRQRQPQTQTESRRRRQTQARACAPHVLIVRSPPQ